VSVLPQRQSNNLQMFPSVCHYLAVSVPISMRSFWNISQGFSNKHVGFLKSQFRVKCNFSSTHPSYCQRGDLLGTRLPRAEFFYIAAGRTIDDERDDVKFWGSISSPPHPPSPYASHSQKVTLVLGLQLTVCNR
jgi:hypothetical protein